MMLCGVEDRRNEMIKHHASVGRIFDVVDVTPMDDNEMKEFFKKAFESAQISVEDDALGMMTIISEGLPKIMHEIGDAAYFLDKDKIIDVGDAIRAIFVAKEVIGGTDQEVGVSLEQEDGDTQGGRARWWKTGAHTGSARHTVKCAE